MLVRSARSGKNVFYTLSLAGDLHNVALKACEAVSYTHLDVYKRQEEISRYWCSLLHAENSCKRIIAAYEAAQGGKTGL